MVAALWIGLQDRETSVFDFLMGVFEEKCYSHDIATDYEFMRIIEEELW